MTRYSGKQGREAPALPDDVQRTANTTQKIKLGRPSKRRSKPPGHAPQVMVKVTGFCKDGGRAFANLRYISRHGKVALENERGEKIEGKEAAFQYAEGWSETIRIATRTKRANGRQAARLVFSMPPGTPPDKVLAATRAMCAKQFAGHEYVMALHTDTEKPHVHLLLMMRGEGGKRVKARKADLREWRESFAVELNARGVAATAEANRLVRGKMKARRNEDLLKRLVDGDKTHKPGRSRVAKAIAEQAATAPHEPGREPWRKPLRTRQEKLISQAVESAAALTNPMPRFMGTNGKALKHEPVIYNAQDETRRRTWQFAAAKLHESGSGRAASEARARTLAGLRDVPRRDVEHQRRHVAVLLPLDAHDRLSDRFKHSADLLLRRSGVGTDGVAQSGRVVAPAVGFERKTAFVPTGQAAARAAAWREVAERIEPDLKTALDTEKARVRNELGAQRPEPRATGQRLGSLAGLAAAARKAVAPVQVEPSKPVQVPAPAPKVDGKTPQEHYVIARLREDGWNESKIAGAIAHLRSNPTPAPAHEKGASAGVAPSPAPAPSSAQSQPAPDQATPRRRGR